MSLSAYGYSHTPVNYIYTHIIYTRTERREIFCNKDILHKSVCECVSNILMVRVIQRVWFLKRRAVNSALPGGQVFYIIQFLPM